MFVAGPVALHCCSNDPSQEQGEGTGWLGMGLFKAFASLFIWVDITMFDTEGVRDAGDWYAISGMGEVAGIDDAGMDKPVGIDGVAGIDDAGMDKPVGIDGVAGIDDVAGVGLVDCVLRVLDRIAPGHLISQAGSLVS